MLPSILVMKRAAAGGPGLGGSGCQAMVEGLQHVLALTDSRVVPWSLVM